MRADVSLNDFDTRLVLMMIDEMEERDKVDFLPVRLKFTDAFGRFLYTATSSTKLNLVTITRAWTEH